jgi:hypothetical protein
MSNQLEASEILPFLPLGIEKNGYIVGRERSRVAFGAGAYDCLVVLARTQPGLKHCRQFGDAVGRIAHDVPRLPQTCITSGHAAGLPGILLAHDFAIHYLHTGLGEKTGNCRLLCVETERLNQIGKIFHCIILIATHNHRNTDSVNIWIKKIFAMTFGVHPEIVNHGCNRDFGYIFGDKAEVCPGVGSAFRKFRFAGKLVGDIPVRCHFAGVSERRLRQSGIKMKWLQTASYAVLIGGSEKKLFSNIRRGTEYGLGAQNRDKSNDNQGYDSQDPAESAWRRFRT